MSLRDAGLDRNKLLSLMAYADGELSDHELATLEQELAANPDAVATLESMRSLGDRVRRDLSTTPDLTDSIMARIAAETRSPAVVEGARVLDLAAARSRRMKIGSAAFALVAAAAAVALWIGKSGLELPIHGDVAASALGVQVQQVDSQENVTVFSIPALHSNASSVVVWLGDDHQEEAAQPKTEDAAAQPSEPEPRP